MTKNVLSKFDLLNHEFDRAERIIEKIKNDEDIELTRAHMMDLSLCVRSVAEKCLDLNIAISNYMWKSWEKLREIKRGEKNDLITDKEEIN